MRGNMSHILDPYEPPKAAIDVMRNSVLRIEYENTFLDVWIFHAIHQFLAPALQVLYGGSALFVLFSWLRTNEPASFAFVTAGLLYVAMWLIQFVFNGFYLYSKRNESILAKHVVEVQDDAFYEETKYNRSYFYWNGIVKVVKLPGFVAVYVTPRMANIIPRRAFYSPAHENDFVANIRAKINSVISNK